MAPEKVYNPAEPITITLTWEQWGIVLHWLQYGKNYHDAEKWEWLAACADRQLAAEMAAIHERNAAIAGALHKIIEDILCPPPKPPETE